MTKQLIIFLISVVITSTQTHSAGISNIAIIPQPVKMDVQEGTFTLTPTTNIVVTEDTCSLGQYLAELLAPATGFNLKVEQHSKPGRQSNRIFLLDVSGKNRLGPEGYDLKVMQNSIFINARTKAGIFYACQSLRQLLPAAVESKEKVQGAAWTIPCVQIEDRPRYKWRGLLLAPTVDFMSVDFLKRYIDLMAYCKMNRLHFHLTEGNAWTLKLKKYPELTDMDKWPVKDPNQLYGIYSQDDIREILDYAKSRCIMVVPCIEMISHFAIAAATYPELMCSNNPLRTGQLEWNKLNADKWAEPCIGKEKIFEFFEDVLSDVVELFPAPYIHIGGDEYFGFAWAQCPDCQKRIKDEALESEDSEQLRELFAKPRKGHKDKYFLYRYAFRRLCESVVSKGRRPILWDDLSWRGKFPKGVVIMQWHYKGGTDWQQMVKTPECPAIEPATAGHDVIACPYNRLYFDDITSRNEQLTLEKIYNFEPTPRQLTDQQAEHILGPHGCMWDRPERKENGISRLFPRMCPLAEIAWSPRESKNWNDFKNRLRLHGERLSKLGVKFQRDPVIWQD